MKALILAGGQGDRLNHRTENNPKALVPVADKALISYTLDLLREEELKEIAVIVGYQASLLSQFITQHYPSVRIFETPHYDKGSILGMQCALSFLDDDFLLLNADHIYPKRLFNKFLQNRKQGITIACDFDRKLVADDMKIKRDEKNHLKAIHKTLIDYDGGYIGMTFCPKNQLRNYFEASEITLGSLGPKACVEQILGQLAKQNEIIHITDTSGIRWLEIDTEEDLIKAEKTIRTEPQFLK